MTAAASARLFAVAATPAALAALPEARIAKLIFPAGFYNTKARQIREIARRIARRPRRPRPGRPRRAARASRRRPQDREPRPRPRLRHPGDLRRHPRAPDLEPPRPGADEDARADRARPREGPAAALLDRDQRPAGDLRPERLPADLAVVLDAARSPPAARASASRAAGRRALACRARRWDGRAGAEGARASRHIPTRSGTSRRGPSGRPACSRTRPRTPACWRAPRSPGTAPPGADRP